MKPYNIINFFSGYSFILFKPIISSELMIHVYNMLQNFDMIMSISFPFQVKKLAFSIP